MEVRRAYEVMLLVRPDLSDEDREKLWQEFAAVLEKNGCELFHRSTMGKRQLAYPIERYEEGHYELFYIAAYPSQLPPVERWLKLNPNVLRYMMVRINRAHLEYLQETQSIKLPPNVSVARPK